ncbi:MAG TPA: DUF4185 domain-containing protein [Candidatus Polarisedimenticolia bacterium]|nr:DUF4185 domain-containing protein [Candidatus Polarisedimenticolia bacterium]
MTTPFKQISVLLALLFVLSAGAQPPFGHGRPAPGMNALFQQTNGWVGGDGAYSVPLTREKTLWLFSDTWVGNVRDGRRTNVTMVNNTLALQEGRGAKAKMEFIIRRDTDGKPVAFVTPEDKRGWFWLQAGACIDQHLFLFLTQIEKTDEPGVFGFRQIGQSLGIVTNPLAPPLDWHIEQHKLPCTEFTSKRHRTFGAATLVDGGYLYIYGIDEDIHGKSLERYSTLARVPTNHIADFSAWRYYADGQWDVDFRKASRIADHMASEYSVSIQRKLGQYVLVYTDRGLSPKIQVRTSPTPWGKWSDPITVYQCPEMSKDKRLFCYSAKAHPAQITDDALMISYVVNSYDFGQVINDASLYWPRFVRVPVASSSGAAAK